ncbi:MAG: hypothetical protein ACUVTR_02065 [Dehalococcoidia bacterium]
MSILTDREFITKAREHYEKSREKYPPETAKIALKNIKTIEDATRWRKGVVSQSIRKAPWQMTIAEFYKPVELPKNWKEKGYRPIMEKTRTGRTRIVKVIAPDGTELVPLDDFGMKWARGKYGFVHEEIVKKALQKGLPVPPEVLADYPALAHHSVPSIPHLYVTPVRRILDELERLRKSDPEEFYRRVKEISDAIKERERGKIKKLPDISLRELREIKKEADMLYR